MEITPRQKQALEFIQNYFVINRQSPVISEIQEALSLSSPASVHQLLNALEREGFITRVKNARRGIELTREFKSENTFEIPVLGVIAAGRPIEAVLQHKTILVPPSMIGKNRTFALRIEGDSMIDAGIVDGCYIVVESSQTANKGETVVALINDSKATVKNFYPGKGQVELRAANKKYKPIIIKPPDTLTIQGVVTGWLKFCREDSGKR
jgi:repressor LexA